MCIRDRNNTIRGYRLCSSSSVKLDPYNYSSKSQGDGLYIGHPPFVLPCHPNLDMLTKSINSLLRCLPSAPCIRFWKTGRTGSQGPQFRRGNGMTGSTALPAGRRTSAKSNGMKSSRWCEKNLGKTDQKHGVGMKKATQTKALSLRFFETGPMRRVASGVLKQPLWTQFF